MDLPKTHHDKLSAAAQAALKGVTVFSARVPGVPAGTAVPEPLRGLVAAWAEFDAAGRDLAGAAADLEAVRSDPAKGYGAEYAAAGRVGDADRRRERAGRALTEAAAAAVGVAVAAVNADSLGARTVTDGG